MSDDGPRGGTRLTARRIVIAVALIVGLVLAGVVAAGLLAHPSSSAGVGLGPGLQTPY